MNKTTSQILSATTVLLTFAALAPAGQQPSVNGVPVSIVVTLEPKRGKTIASIEQQDIAVRQQKNSRPVNGFTSLTGADTQVLLLIDDSAAGSFGTEIATLKQFITSLPANYSVGIGYMRNGIAQMAQNFTQDHAAAANQIRLTVGFGGADVSPYDSLTDAVRNWPASGAQRKEVLMISSGSESLGGGYSPDNPYVNAGIESAIKAGIVVYTIYNPGAGHMGHSLWRTT